MSIFITLFKNDEYDYISFLGVRTMFDFGNANKSQRQAIETTEGPVLITAGPGTGKTFTLVQRAIYLIQEKGVRPEAILLARLICSLSVTPKLKLSEKVETWLLRLSIL